MWRQRAQHLVLILTHGVESCTNIDYQTPSSGWAVKCSHRRYQTFGRGSQQPGCCPRRCRSDCCHTWERRVCNLGQLRPWCLTNLSLRFQRREASLRSDSWIISSTPVLPRSCRIRTWTIQHFQKKSFREKTNGWEFSKQGSGFCF